MPRSGEKGRKMPQLQRRKNYTLSFSSLHSAKMAKTRRPIGSLLVLRILPIFRRHAPKTGNDENRKGRWSANSNGLNVIVWFTMRGCTNGSLATGRRLPEVPNVNPSPIAAEGI